MPWIAYKTTGPSPFAAGPSGRTGQDMGWNGMATASTLLPIDHGALGGLAHLHQAAEQSDRVQAVVITWRAVQFHDATQEAFRFSGEERLEVLRVEEEQLIHWGVVL